MSERQIQFPPQPNKSTSPEMNPSAQTSRLLFCLGHQMATNATFMEVE